MHPVTEKNSWNQRMDQRRDMVNKYLERFKHTNIWLDAVREGYDLYLERFVREVANVQAQMIIPEQSGVGWGNIAIHDSGQVDPSEINSFMRDQQRQAQMGFIDVGVPTGRIQNWKESVEYTAQRIAESERKKKPTEALGITKSKLDMEIDRQIAERKTV